MSSHRSPEPRPDVAPSTSRGGEEQELRAARRSLVLFVIALAAALVGLIAAASGLIDEDGGDTTVEVADDGEVLQLGPDAGEDVAPYVDARRRHLDEVEGRHVAVVSFASYLAERDALDRLGDAVEVVSLLVAFPADEPRRTQSAADERAAVVEEAASQLEEISALVDTVEDPEFAEFYRSELLRYRKVVAEASRDDVVFGAVVRGRAADLRALASHPDVRLVDAGDGTALADDAVVTGLRPEESITVGEPQFRP